MMLRNFYSGMLCLYPAAYRQTFGKEMIEIYERAARESKRGGPLGAILFSAREMAGLAAGVVAEWKAKWAAPETYAAALEQTGRRSDLPPDVAEVQGQLDRLIRSMEFAIAHHDFPKARLYSDKERETRRRLNRLLHERNLESGTAPV